MTELVPFVRRFVNTEIEAKPPRSKLLGIAQIFYTSGTTDDFCIIAVCSRIKSSTNPPNGVTAEAVGAGCSPSCNPRYKAAREAPPHAVAMPAESNSMKAMPLHEAARQSNIAENDPLLVRAVKAQEKADWRTSWES